jgi:hypothetical protein
MSGVTGGQTAEHDVVDEVELSLLGTFAAAVVVGGGVALAARTSAVALLIAVAVVQAMFAAAWVFGTAMPGRKGALVLAALAATASDVVVSVWPDGRLGTLVAILGLAIPAMFVHQLMRGAARVQVVSSLSAIALLLFAEVSLPALVQLRHEFGTHDGGKVSSAVAAALGGALVIGCLVDLLLPAPRFDPSVARGLLALIGSTGCGGSIGYLLLKDQSAFAGGRSTFTGAALGALAGLLAVASAFVLHTTPEPPTDLGRRLRPLISALLPIAVIAPVAFLLCLAIRS